MSEPSRYELLEEIGRGDLGVTWRGYDTTLGVEVAVKVLDEAVSADPDRARHVLDGASRLAALKDDGHFVRVLDVDRAHGRVVLEHLPDSMARRVAKRPVPPADVRDALKAALAALSRLHAAGLLHGHLKPGALLIGDNGRVKLGEAPFLELRPAGGEMRRPEGSPKYLAPELIDPGFGPVTPAADLYSLGFVMLELLVGPDFDGRFRGTGGDAADPEIGWLRLHGSREEAIPATRSVAPKAPADLARVIDKLLSREVSGRYARAEDALRDLGGELPEPEPRAAPEPRESPETVKPLPGPAPKGPLPWHKRKGVMIGGACAVFGLLLASLVANAMHEEDDGTVALRIESVPPGGTIFIDGKKLDQLTDADFPNVTAAKRTLRVERDGYEAKEVTIDFATDPRRKLTFMLVKKEEKPEETKKDPEVVEKPKEVKKEEPPPAPVQVVINSRPIGAAVSLDGEAVGKTPFARKLPPGSYALRLTMAGYSPLETTLAVKAGDKGRIDLDLPLVKTETSDILNSIGMKLKKVPLPGGGHAFFGVHEVTQKQYHDVVGGAPISAFFKEGAEKALYPVEGLTYNDAAAYCVKLSALTAEKAAKRRYRLPTMAEWEHACRAGTTTKYHSGDEPADLDRVGWFKDNSDGKTRPVGAKAANAWGLFDMHGNVMEFCADELAGKGKTQRVAMGGSFAKPAPLCSATSQLRTDAGSKSISYGMRVVCELGQ